MYYIKEKHRIKYSSYVKFPLYTKIAKKNAEN